jgi:hypothetical protein
MIMLMAIRCLSILRFAFRCAANRHFRLRCPVVEAARNCWPNCRSTGKVERLKAGRQERFLREELRVPSMIGRLGLILLAFVAAIGAMSAPVQAINIVIDYSYDTNNFFGNGNPQGAAAGMQARSSLEAAASYFSSILNDTFSAVTVPQPYHSTAPGSNGVVSWSWEQRFQHPTTAANISIANATIPANQYRIYAGARSIPGITAGIGAVGGYSWESNVAGSNSFTNADINTITLTTSNFENVVERRGEPTGSFGRWGGAISFDTNPGASWHYNHTTQPAGNVIDFYSVALHELAHSLGFGESDISGPSAWSTLVSGSYFDGGNAKLQNGGNPVPLSADESHWANNTMSIVYGGSTSQEALMDPDFQNGNRKSLTALDAAGLKDIGWELIAPPPPPAVNGDYNNNGVVDAADYAFWRDKLNQSITIPNDATPGTVTASDYTVWRSNFGRVPGVGSAAALSGVPEPTMIVYAIAAIPALIAARRKRRG